MRVIVLGGDGFCGWPSALHLSTRGHDVTIVDNFSRRNIDNELEVQSLTPIQPLSVRLAAWREVTGKSIAFKRLDVAAQYDRLVQLIAEVRPDSIVHIAEPRAAPAPAISRPPAETATSISRTCSTSSQAGAPATRASRVAP